MSKLTIVTSHWKEDLTWLKKSKFPVVLIDKEGADPTCFEAQHVIPNKGFEVSALFTYIIKNYECLPEYIAFIHGHETSYHQKHDKHLLEVIESANIDKYGFIPLNNYFRNYIFFNEHIFDLNTYTRKPGLMLKDNFERLRITELPENQHMVINLGFQFIVSRERILNIPIQHWEYWYKILMEEEDDKTLAVVFEYSFHAILGNYVNQPPAPDWFSFEYTPVWLHELPIVKRRILVTGSNGFIARHFLRRIEKNIIEIVNKNEDIVEVLDDFKPELIVHLGAELKDESKMFESNVLLTMKILEWVRVNSKTKLILFGTSSEYGHSNKPRNESDCPLPDTIYEGTKAATAMLARAWSKTYNLDVLFVRPFTVYGHDEKPYKLSQVLFRKWKDGTTLTLSNGMHDYVYIDDFIDVLEMLISKDFKSFEIINVGSGFQRSNYEFVRIFEEVTGHKFSIEPMKSKDPAMWVCDISKKNFNIPYIESGIRRMVAEYLNDSVHNSSH